MSQNSITNQNYIAGVWIPAQSGQTFDVLNPANQDLITSFPDRHANDALA